MVADLTNFFSFMFQTPTLRFSVALGLYQFLGLHILCRIFGINYDTAAVAISYTMSMISYVLSCFIRGKWSTIMWLFKSAVGGLLILPLAWIGIKPVFIIMLAIYTNSHYFDPPYFDPPIIPFRFPIDNYFENNSAAAG